MKDYIVDNIVRNSSRKELNKIFAPLLSLDSDKIQIFVHGSWSDNSTTAFSDLDDFIVIDDEYYDLAKPKLDEVAFNFQKKDPLQHHGHWLIKKSQLAQYDNSYMPLFIMKDAICLMGNNQIKATTDDGNTINKNIERIKSTCRNIALFYEKYKEGILNIYDLKRFIGSIVLLPPLIFQIKGEPLNKSSAIFKANLLYSKKALKLIQWSTECRENWELIVEHETFLNFSKELEKFDNAEKWRAYAYLNAPVLNAEELSNIELIDELIDGFITETLYHIDDFKFQKKEVKDYENAFHRVKEFSIEQNAILVGQFGSIKYPSISDLDVFICFEDKEYSKGCLAVNDFIRKDKSLSYLFTHSPLYVCRSMLHDIKFLHTIYDLDIVYNPLKIKLNKELSKDYQDFLNIAWSYLIINTMNTIVKNINYYDIRTLLLSLKNAQTSVFNLEEKLGVKSNELIINHKVRLKVLKEGIKSRELVESEFLRVYSKFKTLLKELDESVVLKKGKYRIFTNRYIVSDTTKKENSIIYLNKVFSNLILDIYKERDENSKKYIQTIRKNFKIHQKYGGYINTYIWIVPYNYIAYNTTKKLKVILKLILLKINIIKN